MADPVLTTAPTFTAISPQRAKSHLRVDHHDEDADIDDLCRAADAYVGNLIDFQICSAIYAWSIDEFPEGRSPLIVTRPPLVSVSSIVYVDSAGDDVTLSSADYKVSTTRRPGRITPAYGDWWPFTRDEPDAITVNYAAGWASPEAVPEDIKQALRLIIAHWFENREALALGTISKELEIGVRDILGEYLDCEFDRHAEDED